MEFKKYQHLERFGTEEVLGIDKGWCYIFPKIDGTNGSIWLDENGDVKAGSRNRTLSLENDNQGFFEWVKNQTNIKEYLKENPTHRLYGEWLVPHTFKMYNDDAWRQFYVFDVMNIENSCYMPYSNYYKNIIKKGIEIIKPINIIRDPSYEDLKYSVMMNKFLVKDNEGPGEGIVIKNYGFYNKYGRQTWAKIISSNFKEIKKENTNNLNKILEEKIVEEFITKHLCEKVLSKIKNEDGFTSKKIPQLLNTIYYDLIKEESWSFIKKYKNPIIDFRLLRSLVFEKSKENLPEIF